jgi:hypothetical protein
MLLAGVTLGALLGIAGETTLRAATGTIYFNSVESYSSPMSLRRVNPDGSGNQSVLVALPEPSFPVASRQGGKLLLTSSDPGRPFKLSRNVFNLDLATGGLVKVTGFEDSATTGIGSTTVLTNGVASHTNDTQFSSYTIHFPYHKAHSPDGQQIAVMNLPRTGGSTLNVSRTNAPTEQFLGSGRLPALELYPAVGPSPIGTALFLSAQTRTGFNQGGDGVDWHPTANEVVATFSSDVPVIGNTGQTSMEGTLLAVVATDRSPSFVRKLTNPVGEKNAFFDVVTFISTTAGPHDYAPAISPNGLRVAYVRHTQRADTRFDGAGIAPLPAICAIRMIDYDGTDDHEVLRMAEGLWVTRIAWSPDGTEIVFDLAPQLVLNGLNALLGDVTRSAVYLVNADGTNPRLLAAAPAAYPTWSPQGAVTPPPPRLRIARDGAARLQLHQTELTPGREVDLESSPDSMTWTRVRRDIATTTELVLTIEPSTDDAQRFFRLVTR